MMLVGNDRLPFTTILFLETIPSKNNGQAVWFSNNERRRIMRTVVIETRLAYFVNLGLVLVATQIYWRGFVLFALIFMYN